MRWVGICGLRSPPRSRPDGPIVETLFGFDATDYPPPILDGPAAMLGLEPTVLFGRFPLWGGSIKCGAGWVRLYLSTTTRRCVRLHGPRPRVPTDGNLISELRRLIRFLYLRLWPEEVGIIDNPSDFPASGRGF